MAIRITANTRPYKQIVPKDNKELRAIINERIEKDKNADLNDIDVSEVEDMSNLFYRMDICKIKIDKWDVSHVKDFEAMFMGCHDLEADLSKWDVSSGRKFSYMFYQCEKFDSDLSKWAVRKDMPHYSMFVGCGKMTREKLPTACLK